jgi:hypothetical protein
LSGAMPLGGVEERPQVAALLRSRAVSAARLESALAGRPVPVVEGPHCTFVFRGEADGVAVEHRVAGLPVPLPLRRSRGSDLWFVTADFPRGARVEYRLLVRRGDRVESILDPLNQRVARGPTSEMSVLEADGYVTPDWTQPRLAQARAGDPVCARARASRASVSAAGHARRQGVPRVLGVRNRSRQPHAPAVDGGLLRGLHAPGQPHA